jgi:hypothetical protein
MIDCSPNFIRPIAYDIKSLQTTAFRFASGERGTRARLVVRGARSDGGDLVLLDKVVDATVDSGWDVGPGPYYVTWNGRDEKGGRLRYSAGYTWTLSVSLPGRAPESASGTVIVSRILFVRSGASFGLPSIQTGYLRPGAVNVYLTTGTQVATGDTLSLKLSGPGGLSTRTRSFAVGRGTTCSARFAGSDAPRRSGIHSFTFTARRSSDYRMTVIQ